MMAAKVRLSDVAREAKVSLGAVAKVLSGAGGNIRVSDAKAEIIRQAAEKLHYRPNIAARTLAGSSGRVVGVMIDSGAPAHYFRTVFQIERELAKADYRIMIAEAHDDVKNFIEGHRTLLQYGVDGVICVSHDYPGENHLLEEYFRNQPNTVFIGRPGAGTHLVNIDWATGTAAAANYLLKQGRRRLALIVSESEYVSRYEREAGFRQAIAACPEAALQSRIAYLPSGHPQELRDRIHFALTSLLPDLDGVLLENDLQALFLIREIRRLGISVPESIAVIGHNNEDFAAGCEPPLATVDECSGAQAAAAVRILLGQLTTVNYELQSVNIVPEIIWRESAG